MDCVLQPFLLVLEFQEKIGRERGLGPWGFCIFSRGIFGQDDLPVWRYLLL